MTMDIATLGIRVDATEARLAAIELDKLSTAGGKTAQSMSAVEKAMQGLTGMVAGISFGMLAKSILDTNREMESLRASLKSVTGSAQGAQAAFNSILTFAKDTPYEVKGLTQTFIMLQNMGIKPTQKVMQSLTDQASLLGGSQEVLTSIALQLGQAHSKGKLQMEDMVVLMQRGVPVMRLLGEITGKNAAELSEMSAKGTITIDMIDKLIIKMGEAAAGSNANAMETLNGKISSLSDAWHTFEDALLNDKSEGFLKKIVTAWTIELDVLTALVNKSSDNQLEKMQGTMAFHQNLKKLIAMSPLGYFIKPSQDESKGDLAKIEQLKAEAAAQEALLNSKNKEKVVLGESLQAKKEHEKAAKAAARAEASLAKSFDDTITSLSLNIVEQSQSKRQLEEATLVSKKYNKAMIEQAMVLWDAKEALIAKTKLHEDEKAQLDSLIDRYNKATMSARDYYSSTLTTTSPDGIKSPMSGADKAPLLAQFDKTTVAETAAKAHEDANEALKKYNETIDETSQKTQDLGAISSSIFDGALGGINLLVGALKTMTDEIANNSKEMTRLSEEKQRIADFQPQGIDQEAEKFKAAKKNTKELAALDKKSVQDQMTGARQIAGAASKMFAEKSAGAKAFHAIEVGIAVAQLAMRAKDMAMSAIATVKNIAEGASKLFAQSGWLGFAGVAAMLALMAGLGYMASSGGGGGAAPPPTDTGTGTVLGDPTAVSESIGKTNDLLKTIHASEYVELRGINRGVNGLQGAISKTLDNLFQNGGMAVFQLAQATLTGASGFISGLGGMAGKISEFFIGGKKTQSIVAQGIGTNATNLKSVIDGGNVGGYQFADIQTKTSGGIFGKKKTSYSTQYQALNSDTQKSLNNIFSSVGDTIVSIAGTLGKSIETDLMPRVMSATIPAMRVDLKGLNGEDASKKLNGVISAMMDTMTTQIFGDIVGKYQKLGEGMLETTVRIVSEIVIVQDALKQSGLKLLAKDVIAVSDALVQAAGGLEEFQKQFEGYYDKFYSESEKTARLNERLVGSLAEVGLKLADTRAGYRAQIDALDMTNALDQQRYSTLLELSSAADQYYSSLESIRNSMKLMTQDNFKTAFDYKKYLSLASLSGVQSATDLLGLGVNTFIPTGQAAVNQLPQISLPTASDTPVSVAIAAVATSNSDVVTEVRALRVEQQAQALAIAQNTADTTRIIKRWDGDGMPAVRTTV